MPVPSVEAAARAAARRLRPRHLRRTCLAVALEASLLATSLSFVVARTQPRNGAAGEDAIGSGQTGGLTGSQLLRANLDVAMRRPKSQESKKHRPGTWKCGCDACITFDSSDDVDSERESLEQHYKKYHDMFVDLPSVVFPERALRMRQSLACSGCSMSGDEGPGEAVWAAGVALALHISQSIPPGRHGDETIAPWRGVNVLELGSGTGVAGIAAAAEGANVLLTDRDTLMPLMAKNVRLNQDYIEIGSADYEAFDWATPPPKEVASESWDVVLCAESVTRSADVHPFVDALASLLGPHGAGAGATAIYAHHPSASQSPGLDVELQRAFKARGLRCSSLPPLASRSAGQAALGEVVFWTLQGSSREGAGSRVRAFGQRLAGMLKAFVSIPQSVK